MNWGAIIIIVGLVFFLGVIPLVLLQSQQRKKKYGPKRQTGGLKVMQGSLVCQNWKAPTLGKKLRFDYVVRILTESDNFWGNYHYPSDPSIRKPVYTGEVLLTASQGEIKGKTDQNVVEGQLNPHQGVFTLGFPRGSLLSWLNSPFQFGIKGQEVDFLNTSKGTGRIGRDSHLRIGEGSTVGRLEDWKGAWVMEVDVTYWEVAPEIVVLIILLMSNDIFEFHNR